MKHKIEGWRRELHKGKIKGELFFWRNISNKGFVSINKVERKSYASKFGEYQVQINTPNNLDTKYFKTKKTAILFVGRFMRRHPNG